MGRTRDEEAPHIAKGPPGEWNGAQLREAAGVLGVGEPPEVPQNQRRLMDPKYRAWRKKVIHAVNRWRHLTAPTNKSAPRMRLRRTRLRREAAAREYARHERIRLEDERRALRAVPEVGLEIADRIEAQTEAGRQRRLAAELPSYPCQKCGCIETPARYADRAQAAVLRDGRLCWSCAEWSRWSLAYGEVKEGRYYVGGILVGSPPAWWLRGSAE